jgi:hypothetical protein
VGQDGILRAGCQPAQLAGHQPAAGVANRLPTCPTSSDRKVRIQLVHLGRRQNAAFVHRQVRHLAIERSRNIEARIPDEERLVRGVGVSHGSGAVLGSGLGLLDSIDENVRRGGAAHGPVPRDGNLHPPPGGDGSGLSKITIAAKVFVSTLATEGICEKNDGNSIDSGFLFGSSDGTLRFTIERASQNMRVYSAAVPVLEMVTASCLFWPTVTVPKSSEAGEM